MSFEDVHRRLEAKKAAEASKAFANLPAIAQLDIEGLVRNALADALAAHMASLPPPEPKPLPQRIEALVQSYARHYKGMPPAAPSHVDAPPPSNVPQPGNGPFEMSVLSRDAFGRIHRVQFDDHAKRRAFIGEVTMRDELHRVQKMKFAPMEMGV
ncbi:hypothetical protein [Pseudogulbenkiania sp. MAI-1]|uniref:hypothetical protein n=1 Tax=Pseudogulbenkiania sp. MAI-1 TaxID=990370 RepID=UPI00045EA9BB|nr:hypothetical protein [Pseudogulbenkiania sp. MAI-1]